MIELNASPSKQRAVKSRRVLEWVNQSFNGGPMKSAQIKRKSSQAFASVEEFAERDGCSLSFYGMKGKENKTVKVCQNNL